MQVILNKKKKEELGDKLYQGGKSVREMVQLAHLSFGTIGKVDRRIDAQNNNDEIDLRDKSIETQAIYRFSIKTPLEVAIELNLPATKVHNLQEEFWALNQHYDLALAYGEIKYLLPSFMMLNRSLKDSKILDEAYLFDLLKYACHDPSN